MNQSMIDCCMSKSRKMTYKLEPLSLENGKAGLRQPLGVPVYQCLKKDMMSFAIFIPCFSPRNNI